MEKLFVDQSKEGLAVQTQAHNRLWHIGEADQWNVDQESGKISWSFSDGTYVEADVQIIGTYNPNDGTFLWGWDHPSVLKKLQRNAQMVKEYGTKHNISKFTNRKILCTEDEAWEFTAIANRLSESNGGYRG
ncbi:MAG: hypothetical protein GY765_26860, partial [bacterium]|nr:hypothetical protein [bacterium]